MQAAWMLYSIKGKVERGEHADIFLEDKKLIMRIFHPPSICPLEKP